MIELTVRTLDSQNHRFSVEDDITVEQFKTRIADTVNIPAETQRIIYCGRVLQDSSKLSDYDVHGKVVHLVQRAPPAATTTRSNNSRSASPQPQRRGGFRGFPRLDHGNTMYLGSMAFPSNLMESQGIIPPPPTHSLSGSRLNVANQMLRRIQAIITLLENPSARPEEQSQPDDNLEEEVTPVIEARVIVPNNSEPLDEVINAVQNSLIDATSGALSSRGRNTDFRGSAQARLSSEDRSPEPTASVNTPRRSASAENLSFEERSDNTNDTAGLPPYSSRTTEMSDLLVNLAELQVRFAPFLLRYQSFMQEDPEVPAENQRSVQMTLNRVSEVLHLLGHAYHSLSDIMVRVRTPPPRPLLCRPILIQHSAVVQTGIPIQVEAQINLSADHPPAPAPSTTSQQQPQQTSSTTTTASSESSTGTTDRAAPAASATPPNNPPPTFVRLPFLPSGAAVRMQSFPLEIRTLHAPVSNNNNEGAVPSAATATPQEPRPQEGGGTSGEQPRAQEGAASGGGAAGGAFNFNPNVEFFMEVTPEGITIDSLETTLVGSNQANDIIRGALNGPPPEFLQSLMEMASHIMTRNAQQPPTTATTTEAPPATAAAGQNTQARGNSQPQPTTATHTPRSTSRPHVHLAQQAIQGGFDPFLPCNSHHIARTARRQQQQQQQPQSAAGQQQRGQQEGGAVRQQAAAAAANASQQPAPQATSTPRRAATGGPTAGARGPLPNLPNQNVLGLLNGIFDSLRTQMRNVPSTQGAPAASSNIGDGPTNVAAGEGHHGIHMLASIFRRMAGERDNVRDILRPGLTLEELLRMFQLDYPYVPGENIFTDLQMLFVRNLTLIDLFTLSVGNVEPLNRNRAEIQDFVSTRLCNGDTSPAGVNSAVERLMTELQPFLENFNSLPVRDNVNLVGSAERLLREKLPTIINLALGLNTGGNLQLLLQQCLSTAKTLLALALHASQNGQQGVEQICDQIVTRLIQDVPRDFQDFTLMSSRAQLRQLFANLNVPESDIQPYIVRWLDLVQREEAMDLDEPEATGSAYSTPPLEMEDSTPLPNVIIGSEPWHAQVPEDWVPIITRDAQKQRRQNPQGPFSDAYLSGMPSKRRKIVNSAKPQGSLPQVITDSVRQAVTATGLAAAAPVETVAQLAGASPEIQTAYRNLLRSSVRANLRENEDFLPERFPNAASYFNVEQ